MYLGEQHSLHARACWRHNRLYDGVHVMACWRHNGLYDGVNVMGLLASYWRHNYMTSFCLETVKICSALVTKCSHYHEEVGNSCVLRGGILLSWSLFSKTERSCQALIGGILSNPSSCIIMYTLCICLQTVPRKLCCCAIHIHCVYTWIYCQQISDPAKNDHCADLLRVF